MALSVAPRSRRLAAAAAVVVVATVAVVGAFGAVTAWRTERAVHHLVLAPGLMREGAGDLLVDVWRPGPHPSLYVVRAGAGTTTVLPVPSRLLVGFRRGRDVTAGDVSPRRPGPLLHAVEAAGIPVSRFLGVDLRSVPADSTLGRLLSGRESVAQVLANPVAAASTLTAAAHHVYLGPGTSVSSVLGLLDTRACSAGRLPTRRRPSGSVTVAEPGAGRLVRHFLSTPGRPRCPGGGRRLEALRS